MSTIFKQRIEAGDGPVVFNVPGEKPDGAFTWLLDICDGWKSSPDMEANGTNFGALRDGMVNADVFPMRSRFVTLGGAAYAGTEQDAEALGDVLIREAFPRNRDLRLVRYEAVPKYVTFRRSAGVNTDWSAVQTGFRWDTTLRCVDPMKYSLAMETATAGTAGLSTTGTDFPITFPFVFDLVSAGAADTTATVVNQGTAYSSHITAVLTGPLDSGGWRLRNDTTDEEIWFEVSVADGDTFTIDFSRQALLYNGFQFIGRRFGSWFRLAPGPNEIRLYADFTENTTVTITAESAWE